MDNFIFKFNAFGETFHLSGDGSERLSLSKTLTLMAKANLGFLLGIPAFRATGRHGVWKMTGYTASEITYEWIVYEGSWDWGVDYGNQ